MEHTFLVCRCVFEAIDADYRRRPFSKCPKPLFRGEANCEADDVTMICYSHAKKTHFHKKAFTLSLVLKVKILRTRNWPNHSEECSACSLTMSMSMLREKVKNAIRL